jgi:hypothetical protein
MQSSEFPAPEKMSVASDSAPTLVRSHDVFLQYVSQDRFTIFSLLVRVPKACPAYSGEYRAFGEVQAKSEIWEVNAESEYHEERKS